MYNEYLQDAVPESGERPSENRTPAAGTSGGGLLQLLTDRLGGAKLDADTLVAIAVIWFCCLTGRRWTPTC